MCHKKKDNSLLFLFCIGNFVIGTLKDIKAKISVFIILSSIGRIILLQAVWLSH